MRPLTILVDMDNTIEGLGEAWVPWLNRDYGLSVEFSKLKDFDVQKAFPTLTLSQIYKPLEREAFWKTVKPYPDAVTYLKKLKDAGHNIFIVTASYYTTLQMKFDNVLFKYFPYLTNDNIIVAQQKQMIEGDIFIDDYPGNFGGSYFHGILLSQPYNLQFDEHRYGIYRAFDWKEIYEHILSYIDEHEDTIYDWY